MVTKLLLNGVISPSGPEENLVAVGPVSIQTDTVISLSTAGTRGDQPTIPPLEAQDDNLVEIEYMDGGREWMRVDTLRSRLGATGTRGATSDTLIMPAQMPIAAPTTTRGLPALWIKTVKHLKLAINGPADVAVNEIVQQIEAKLAPGPGLYQMQLDGSYGGAPIQGELTASKRPYLILIHGTFSSIGAAYAALFDSPEWRQLYSDYDGRIYGFNHCTLSESPVENALALLTQLPRDAHIHLVTHSRGGLVGELLCLHEIQEEQLAPFRKAQRTAEIERLRQLSTLLIQKHLFIDRFVRVACPAAGTLLASQRLDRYLSVILNLATLALGGSDPFLAYMKANILTLIQTRADPQQLPGLEAQMPESPLVALLNRSGLQCNADLAVIAGDCQVSSDLFQSLKVLAGDAFYWEDHDLVVNTQAMARGVERKAGYRWLTTGPNVAHSNYFANADSRRRVYRWLTRTPAQALVDFEGFAPIVYRDPEDVRLRSARAINTRAVQPQLATGQGDAATVVLIPGLFGSELLKDAKPLWLDLAALTQTGLQPLALPATDETISVGGVIMTHYQQLVEQLRQRFYVLPFAYDWRQSLVTAAQTLADQLQAELAQHNQPIHLLAHSAGGLVARLLITQHPALWNQLKTRGGRLVLVGVPHQGTQAAVELLSGQAALTRLLSYVDPALDAAGVSALFWHFPGLVELLPHDAKDWRTTWNRAADPKTATPPLLPALTAAPSKSQLSAAAKVWKKLDAPQPDAAICQVLGSAPWTPSRFELTDEKALIFAGHAAGDGRVTHQSAWLEGIAAWQIPAEHGDLLNYPPAFPGLIDLLESGTTTQLTTATPSLTRGLPAADLVQRQLRPVLFPTQADLLNTALGATPNSAPTTTDKPVTLHLSVLNASLEHATTPLAVGHYQGDVLVGGEAVLNERLENKLAYRQAMNLYPGPVGTVEVVLAPDLSPPGALVIGLGEVGALTADMVTEGIYQAALRLALARLETATKGNAAPLSAAFSALLIGSRGARALSIESSLAAIVSGALLANRTLRQRKLLDQVQIDAIQFVEIYEDLATHAAHALNEIERHLRLALTPNEQLAVEQHLRQGEGGYTGQPAFDFDNGWWRRIQITEQPVAQPSASQTAQANAATAAETAAKPFGKALQYVLLTDRARAELTAQATQRTLVERLVEKSIQTVTTDLALPATLYELLLPNELKSQPLETANLLLVLDEHAAQYPWEMLAQRPLSDNRAHSQPGLRPLAVQKGLLRQLTTATYRTQVQPPSAKKALVIGEPRVTDPLYPALPSARAEATTVAQVLKRHGYLVDALIDKDALTIVNTLFSSDYRIIHIAGHGIYRPDCPAQSGVVLGDNIFLTAAEIAQLPVVPELVFLNCCHLGSIDQARATNQPTTNSAPAWNKLAASVAQALIKIGVRAVVAAGWAVNDSAAEFFARTLYEQMLAEKTPLAYGEAVRYARQALFDHPRWRATNTWGAYQCYGDPGFLLNPTVSRSGMQPQKPVAPQEVVRQLRNYQARASRYHNTALLDQLKKAIIALEMITPPNWLNGELHNEFGDTYGEVGDFARAIAHYRKAREASSPKERVPIRCIEQLANLTARYAMQRHLHPDALSDETQAEQWTPNALFAESEQLLQLLIALADNAEHNALYASYYKRLAVVRTGEQRTTALTEAARYYERAYKLPGKRNEIYWQSNMVLCRIVADEDFTDAEQRDCLKQVEQLEALARQGLGPHATYWERVAVPDLAVIHLLLDSLQAHKSISATDFAPIEVQYRQAIGIGSTVRERRSTFDTLEFLIQTLPRAQYDAFVTALEGLAQSLMQEEAEAGQAA